MDIMDLDELQKKNEEKIKSILESFNTIVSNELGMGGFTKIKRIFYIYIFFQYATLYDFTEFNASGQWASIWKGIFSNLNDPKMASIYPICLNSVRILTRDEESIHTNQIVEDFNCLLKLADLTPLKQMVSTPQDPNSTETVMEALKCLCNIVFLSTTCRQICLKNGAIDGILKRVINATIFPPEIEFYDMKLLFLITALEPSARTKVQIDLNGLTYMTEWLDMKIKSNDTSDKQQDVICEILKVMFNITANADKSPNESEIQNRHLTSVIRQLLLLYGSMETDKERNIITNCINLLTNFATSCLSHLMEKYEIFATTEPMGDEAAALINYEFEGKDMRVLDIFLTYLKMILGDEENMSTISELVPPVLTVLIKCVRCHPTMRHYIRQIVLPPLKDVSKRPEVGSEIRNHLCRFLTMPEAIMRDLSSELLFVCCKENVGRMIKYTGYGNAAGLFANRGVLDCREIEHTEYSSDSEDSDTEEYKEMQHGINPVLGCFEAPRKDPTAGMSEEQKEYEAMELVNLMDKLHRTGLVQPCKIGEDGKPQPVEHILQLQEELPQQQLEQKQKS